MSVYRTHMEIDDVEDVPVEVQYASYPGCKGSRDGRGGLPLEPDEPPCISIEGVRASDGTEVVLNAKQRRAMEDEIGEWIDGMYDPPEPERYHDER